MYGKFVEKWVYLDKENPGWFCKEISKDYLLWRWWWWCSIWWERWRLQSCSKET